MKSSFIKHYMPVMHSNVIHNTWHTCLTEWFQEPCEINTATGISQERKQAER